MLFLLFSWGVGESQWLSFSVFWCNGNRVSKCTFSPPALTTTDSMVFLGDYKYLTQTFFTIICLSASGLSPNAHLCDHKIFSWELQLTFKVGAGHSVMKVLLRSTKRQYMLLESTHCVWVPKHKTNLSQSPAMW